MEKRFLAATILFSVFIPVLQIIGYVSPNVFSWGFHSFGFLSPIFIIIYLCITGIVIYLVYRGQLEKLLVWLTKDFVQMPVLFLTVVVCIFICAAWMFRVQVPLLGDGFVIINIFDNTFRGIHSLTGLSPEPLSILFFYGCVKILGTTIFPNILNAFLLGEMVLGTGFIITTFFISRNITDNPQIQFLSFVYMSTAPYMQLFFGYVETYAVVLCFVSFFIFISELVLREKFPFYLIIPVFTILVYVHFLSLIFGFSICYLCFLEYKRRGIKQILIGTLISIGITLVGLFLLHFDFNRLSRNISHAPYLLFTQINDGYQPYTLFSHYHLIDIFNLFVLLSPSSFFLITLSIIAEKNIFLKSIVIKYLLTCVIPILFFLIIIKYDLGAVKDWDISASYFFVVNLAAIGMFTATQVSNKEKILLLTMMLTVLNSLPWFYLNSTVEPNIKRIKTIMDKRSMAKEGLYQSTFHLSMYYFHTKNTDEMVDAWKQYIQRYPTDGRGYEKLAKSYWELGVTGYDQIDKTFNHWLKIDSENISIRKQYANFCLLAGNTDMNLSNFNKAAEHFQRAIQLDSSLPSGYNNLGNIYIIKNELDSAVLLFSKAIQMDSGYARGYKNLADIYLLKNNPRIAITLYQQAINHDSTYANAYEKMGNAYETIGYKMKANELYRCAARIRTTGSKNILSEKD
jgi:tetratricopeptide (TPR) repeat protein